MTRADRPVAGADLSNLWSAGALPRPRPAPDPLGDDWSLLLEWIRSEPIAGGALQRAARRQRLFERIARSAAAAAVLHTVRHAEAASFVPAAGVAVRTLYACGNALLRPGEPRRVQWIELAPGARWCGPWTADGLQRDWLVVQGALRLDDTILEALDYHVVPGSCAVNHIASDGGATVYLREAPQRDATLARATTATGPDASWADFAPGIKRRLLWMHDGEAAMLYHALPGATVPRHGHGHDEECLMLEGELFLDDVLLRAGEYQLAPSGSHHDGLFTDTGVLIYAHGDLDLAVGD